MHDFAKREGALMVMRQISDSSRNGKAIRHGGLPGLFGAKAKRLGGNVALPPPLSESRVTL